ncbi:transposase domain-containing protein [Pseudomonas sp. MDT1-17]
MRKSTAKVNGQEPYAWLRDVLGRLPQWRTTKRCCGGTARQRCLGKNYALLAVGVVHGPRTVVPHPLGGSFLKA